MKMKRKRLKGKYGRKMLKNAFARMLLKLLEPFILTLLKNILKRKVYGRELYNLNYNTDPKRTNMI